MKFNVILAGAAVATLSVSCTKSKSSDAPPPPPAAQPAPQGNTTQPPPAPPAPPAPAPVQTTPAEQQQQWQQQQQQGQQMPTKSTQASFTIRLRTNIVGEPDSHVMLFPGMRDAKGVETELPILVAPILGPNNVILVPEGVRVWGKILLQKGGQSIFTAGGFLLANSTQYATVGTGLVVSKDTTKFDWATTGWNTLKGTIGGAAVGTILSLTTGDKKIQTWEILSGAGGGALLAAILSAVSGTNYDPLVQVSADGTPINVNFDVTDAKTLPGYKAPPVKAQQQQQQ